MGRPKKTDEPKTERVTLKKLEAKIAELEAKLANECTTSLHKTESGSLEVRSKDGKKTITLMATDNMGVGLWLDNKDTGVQLALFNLSSKGGAHQHGIGIYGPKIKQACPICLTTDENGGAVIQLIDKDNNVIHLTPEDLYKVLDRKPISLKSRPEEDGET